MDSNINKDEEKLSGDSEKLLEHLGERIEEMEQILNDDENFCDQDINTSIKYIENIEKKFNEKIQEFKEKLEKIRIENKKTSEKNKKQFNDEIQEINDLFSLKKYDQAWKKFKDYEKHFQQRSTLIQQIPKLHMNELDIEQYFSSDYKINKSPTIIPTPTITSLIIDDDKQDIKMSNKERLRKEKIIETTIIDKDDKDDEELNNEKHEQNIDKSLFGIRSKPIENQQTIINGAIGNDINSSITIDTSRPPKPFSTRLGPNSNNKNLPFSGRNISVPLPIKNNNNNNSRNNHGPTQSPPIPQNSVCSLNQRQTSSIHSGKVDILILNPVSFYQHNQNIFLLMTCNSQYIILFKSQRNRLDKWDLGIIERRTHTENILDWHDGLIISMGYIENNNIYMFTEREVIIYSLLQRRKLNTRILPRGNDDGSEINNESQRGIGTVYDKYMYHIYLNRNSRWTLSKNLLEKFVHIHDYDLTRLFPDVQRFIHLCVNEKTINFLVQMNDLSYAVVFCSTNDCTINKLMLPIILSSAQQPLTIYSAFIKYINRFLFFINDPLNDNPILHIISTEQYLQSYSIIAHAICYVADKHELIIVTNNSINSINLNEQNLFFSKFFPNYLSDK